MAQGPDYFFSAKFKSWIAAGLTAGLICGAIATTAFAQAQGGETEVRKTVPGRPQPAAQPQAHQLDMRGTAASPAAPAQPQAPATAAQTQPAPAAAAQTQAPAQPVQPTEAAIQSAAPAGAGQPAAAGGAPNWQTGLAAQPNLDAPLLDPAQLATVQKVNLYFNSMTTLQGNFVQTDPDNKEKHGKFYFERPGKVRFNYAPPSKLVIVSDGKYVAIEDYDMKTTDRYPIEMTPFRLLLSEKVDLIQEAHILSVDEGPDAVVVTVEDKTGDSPGRIRLFFSKGADKAAPAKAEPGKAVASAAQNVAADAAAPALANQTGLNLQQWIITDPQGLDTRVQLADLEPNVELAQTLFQFSKTLGFKNLSQ
jgi:outer membrane lipoprotein-sorting protein